jgi:hypothetical protein
MNAAAVATVTPIRPGVLVGPAEGAEARARRLCQASNAARRKARAAKTRWQLAESAFLVASTEAAEAYTEWRAEQYAAAELARPQPETAGTEVVAEMAGGAA